MAESFQILSRKLKYTVVLTCEYHVEIIELDEIFRSKRVSRLGYLFSIEIVLIRTVCRTRKGTNRFRAVQCCSENSTYLTSHVEFKR